MLTSRAHKLDSLAETDGCSASSERTNRRDQRDWPKGLPEACFAFNTMTWWDQTISRAPSKAAHQPVAPISACLSRFR